MEESTSQVKVEFRWVLRKREVDEYVDSIYFHLASYMGSWHSRRTIITELGRIKVTLRHLFPEDEDDDTAIDLTELVWTDWLRTFERLGERSTLAYGNRVSRFLSLHDPRLAVPLKNAVNHHLAELRGQQPPPLQKVPQPLFQQEEITNGSRLSATVPIRKSRSSTEYKLVTLDDLLRSVTEDSEKENSQDSFINQKAKITDSRVTRLRRFFSRKK